MKIEVKLYSILRQGRFEKGLLEIDSGAKVSDLLDRLDLARSDIGLVIINGRDQTFVRELEEGDSVTLLPALVGG